MYVYLIYICIYIYTHNMPYSNKADQINEKIIQKY